MDQHVDDEVPSITQKSETQEKETLQTKQYNKDMENETIEKTISPLKDEIKELREKLESKQRVEKSFDIKDVVVKTIGKSVKEKKSFKVLEEITK